MLATVIQDDRRQRSEQLRRTIQAAKDGAQNLVLDSRWRDNFYAVDIWEKVGHDVEELRSSDSSGIPRSSTVVFTSREPVHRSWSTLIDHLAYYDQGWRPWTAWLEYRLFGTTTSNLTESDWRKIELELALLDSGTWWDVIAINSAASDIINSVIEENVLSEPELEEQSKFALQFVERLSSDKIDLSHNLDENLTPLKSTELYLELLQSCEALIDEATDNSSSYVRIKAHQYRSCLASLEDESARVLLIVRGDALRTQLAFQKELSPFSDIPPLQDSIHTKLAELVSQHNVFVGMNPGLSQIDRMVLGPDTRDSIVPPDVLTSILRQERTKNLITSEAHQALEEVTSQAPNSGDPSDRRVRQASESGKNFFRRVVGSLYRHKRSVGTALVATPAIFYALGHWALANETTLLTYFSSNPSMHAAVEAILKWLHTLPLA